MAASLIAGAGSAGRLPASRAFDNPRTHTLLREAAGGQRGEPYFRHATRNTLVTSKRSSPGQMLIAEWTLWKPTRAIVQGGIQ
jgi:hypothetical protein